MRRRGIRVIIARWRGNMVIWHRPFTDTEFHTDLALRTTGGTAQLQGPDPVRIVRVDQIPKR